MSAASCPDDLLVLARRGALPSAEQATLAEHVAQCPSCRMSAGIGRWLGPLPPVDQADQALAARLVAVALSPRAVDRHAPTLARRPAHRRVWAAAALGVLIAGSASAAWWQYAHRPPPAPPAPAAPPRASRSALRPVALPGPAEVPAAPVPPPPTRPASGPSPLAADLFAAASQARATGDLHRAIALYRQLQTTFPASPEARLSYLSLAQLHARSDRPERALPLYDRFLERGDVTLTEEALIGKARALQRLQRGAEERALWQQFLRDRPGSDYRWRAEQRLKELEPGAP